MEVQNVLSSWGIDSKGIKGINDVRLRQVPVVVETKVSADLWLFMSENNKYYVKTHSLISKGSNGRIYEGHLSDGEKGYTPLVVKKTKSCLNALRECVLQAMIYDALPDNCPQIYNIFRTKNYFWIFMRDLRKPQQKVEVTKSLYYWLNSLSGFAGNKEAAITVVLERVFSMLLDLQQKYSFKHGDLHTQNIFVHSSPKIVKNVFLLDFGYSMVKDRTKYNKSPYWLEYKDGVDCAILLWSLWENQFFKDYASLSMYTWVKQKLVLKDGFDLKTLKTSSDLYQRLDGLTGDGLEQFKTGVVSREFVSL